MTRTKNYKKKTNKKKNNNEINNNNKNKILKFSSRID